MSGVKAAGRALKASFSSTSGSSAPKSPRPMRVSTEYMASTTVHSSVPWVGLEPLRCSSQVKIPLATP